MAKAKRNGEWSNRVGDDFQKKVAKRLYDAVNLAADMLPYTETFERMFAQWRAEVAVGDTMSGRHLFWRIVVNARKNRKLKLKGR